MPEIHHQLTIKATPQKVFDTIALPDGLDNWWSAQSSGKPALGETYTFYFGPEYDWRATVKHMVPGKEIVWKMMQAMDDWIDTEVSFNLAASGDNTKVYFTHTRWREVSEHFAITSYCWAILLQGLKNYVEKGEVVPFAERN